MLYCKLSTNTDQSDALTVSAAMMRSVILDYVRSDVRWQLVAVWLAVYDVVCETRQPLRTHHQRPATTTNSWSTDDARDAAPEQSAMLDFVWPPRDTAHPLTLLSSSPLAGIPADHITRTAYWLYNPLTLTYFFATNSLNQVSTSLGNSGLCWTVFSRNRDTAVPAKGNGDLQTPTSVLVARPRRCLTLLNPVPWQNWMAAYLGYTLQMKTLLRGWLVMVHDTHTRRRRLNT